MNLQFDIALADGYPSKSQIARVLSKEGDEVVGFREL